MGHHTRVRGAPLGAAFGLAALAGGAVVLASVLPYLPGRHDPMAWPVSFAAQVFGVLGLSLVPLGAAWLVVGSGSRAGSVARRAWQSRIRRASLIALAVVLGSSSLGAVPWSPLAGVALLALSAGLVVRAVGSSRREPFGWPGLPAVLLVVPVVTALGQAAVLGPAMDEARRRTMDAALPLIAALDAHRSRTGEYPAGIWALNADFVPPAIGIDRYVYDARGGGFDLLFELPRFHPVGTREVVAFNTDGTPHAYSHVAWRLMGVTAQGWYASAAADRPGWRTFWFD